MMLGLQGIFWLVVLLPTTIVKAQEKLDLQTIIAETDDAAGMSELQILEHLKQHPDLEFEPLQRRAMAKTQAKRMTRSVNTWPCGKGAAVCIMPKGSSCGTCCPDDPTGHPCCPNNPATCCSNGGCCGYINGQKSSCCGEFCCPPNTNCCPNQQGCCPVGTTCSGNRCVRKRSNKLHRNLFATCPKPIPWTCSTTKCCTGEGAQVCCKSTAKGEQCLDIDTSCSACPSPKCAYPSGITDAKAQSAFNYLRCTEGFKTTSYCPTRGSGPTVGAGVDLGQQSKANLQKSGVPSCLIDRVKILLGKQCTDSCVNPSMNKDALMIHLSEEEATTISKCFIAQNLLATDPYAREMTVLGSDVLMSLKHWAGHIGACAHSDPKLCREVSGKWVNYVWDAIKGKTATDSQLKTALAKTKATYSAGSVGYNRLTREIKHLEGKCTYPHCC